MTRNRIGAALFAAGSLTFLWYGLSRLRCGSGCAVSAVAVAAPALGLAALHGGLAFGVAKNRSWARWMGIGVSFAWVLSASQIACSASPTLWLFVALHAPLPLLLASPDQTHPRTSLSLLLAGLALPLALSLGLGELGLLSVSWAMMLGTALVVIGAVGLARERTWGLLVTGAAGLTYLGAGFIDPVASEHQALQVTGLVALPLLAALVPFAEPIFRFLEPRD